MAKKLALCGDEFGVLIGLLVMVVFSLLMLIGTGHWLFAPALFLSTVLLFVYVRYLAQIIPRRRAMERAGLAWRAVEQ